MTIEGFIKCDDLAYTCFKTIHSDWGHKGEYLLKILTL
jgi:hypothetical protein